MFNFSQLSVQVSSIPLMLPNSHTLRKCQMMGDNMIFSTD